MCASGMRQERHAAPEAVAVVWLQWRSTRGRSATGRASPFFARMGGARTQARVQSGVSASCDLASRLRCSSSKMPSSCATESTRTTRSVRVRTILPLGTVVSGHRHRPSAGSLAGATGHPPVSTGMPSAAGAAAMFRLMPEGHRPHPRSNARTLLNGLIVIPVEPVPLRQRQRSHHSQGDVSVAETPSRGR